MEFYVKILLTGIPALLALNLIILVAIIAIVQILPTKTTNEWNVVKFIYKKRLQIPLYAFSIVILTLLDIGNDHFSTVVQRAASYVPFISNDDDKLALKIDGLMKLQKALEDKKEEIELLHNELVKNMDVRREKINSSSITDWKYQESIISQESDRRSELLTECNTLAHALSVAEYLIENAKKRYATIKNDKDRVDLSVRIKAIATMIKILSI